MVSETAKEIQESQKPFEDAIAGEKKELRLFDNLEQHKKTVKKRL